ncbi:MAG: hypothetical protein Q9222_000797 [Ikaeria aurantiellina]
MYHFSDPEAPKLLLTVTSNADKPFTICTHSTILNPHLALLQRKFLIIDLIDGLEIPVSQTSIQIQRLPFRRVRGCSDEDYFLTVCPGLPATVSTSFGPGGNYAPRPKHIMKQRPTSTAHGKKPPRRSTSAHGVDGLEAGHRYRLEVPKESLQLKWWKWGTKDDVLVDPASPPATRMLRSLEGGKAKLSVAPIDGIEFSVEE